MHLIAIEEPETYMHPQMQELMIPLMKEFINRKYISYDTECMV